MSAYTPIPPHEPIEFGIQEPGPEGDGSFGPESDSNPDGEQTYANPSRNSNTAMLQSSEAAQGQPEQKSEETLGNGGQKLDTKSDEDQEKPTFPIIDALRDDRPLATESCSKETSEYLPPPHSDKGGCMNIGLLDRPARNVDSPLSQVNHPHSLPNNVDAAPPINVTSKLDEEYDDKTMPLLPIHHALDPHQRKHESLWSRNKIALGNWLKGSILVGLALMIILTVIHLDFLFIIDLALAFEIEVSQVSFSLTITHQILTFRNPIHSPCNLDANYFCLGNASSVTQVCVPMGVT
jgi:hypothetical protein